jgi:hypothetical protein
MHASVMRQQQVLDYDTTKETVSSKLLNVGHHLKHVAQWKALQRVVHMRSKQSSRTINTLRMLVH